MLIGWIGGMTHESTSAVRLKLLGKLHEWKIMFKLGRIQEMNRTVKRFFANRLDDAGRRDQRLRLGCNDIRRWQNGVSHIVAYHVVYKRQIVDLLNIASLRHTHGFRHFNHQLAKAKRLVVQNKGVGPVFGMPYNDHFLSKYRNALTAWPGGVKRNETNVQLAKADQIDEYARLFGNHVEQQGGMPLLDLHNKRKQKIRR